GRGRRDGGDGARRDRQGLEQEARPSRTGPEGEVPKDARRRPRPHGGEGDRPDHRVALRLSAGRVPQGRAAMTDMRLDAPHGSTRTMLPRWPLFAAFALYPLWWVLGLGSIAWIPLGACMAVLLARRGGVRVP